MLTDTAVKAPAVLYVEDEQFDAVFMQHAFERSGLRCRLQVVDNGLTAIHYLSGVNPFGDRTRYPLPALLLLDLNLPVLSGFDVLNYLKDHPEIPFPPVVVFSSSARPEDKTNALRLGAVDYFEKPSSGLEFASVAQRLWDGWLADKAIS